ncbi:MAG: SNF2 helicase associated domain-containing protein [Cellulosilyticaceae bacterium]
MITITRVQSLASSSAVYDRAVKLLRRGMVSEYSVSNGTGGTQVVRARVQGSGSYDYPVEVELDSEGRITWGCQCPAHFEYDGICKHGTAVLLKYCLEQQSRMGKTVQMEEQVYKSPYTKMMLDYYENDTIREVQHNRAGGDIKVYPKLYHQYNNTFAVGFKIGATKSYVVKNVYEMADNIINEKWASYGKNLEFTHSMACFAEESLPLVRFIVDTVMTQESFLADIDFYGRVPKRNKKVLPLTGKHFDEFFELVHNQRLEFEDSSGYARMVTLAKENPEIDFEMATVGQEFHVRHNLEDYQMVKMPYHYYFILEDKICQCDETFGENIFPLLHYMHYEGRARGDEKLVLTSDDVSKFTATVLPKVKRAARMSVPEKILEEYSPIPLAIKTYFDLNDESDIVGDVVLTYGDTTFKPYGMTPSKERESFVRDIVKEETLSYILSQYGFKVKKGNIELSDEEQIYEFLLKGIDELMAIGEVNVSERLKGRRIIQKPVGSIGIRIESNLLELNFNELQMTGDEIDAVMSAYRTKSKYYRLKNGAFLDLENDEMRQVAHLVQGLGISGKDLEDGSVSVPKHRAIYIDNVLKESQQIEIERDKPFKQLIRQIKNVEDADYEVPQSLKKTLRSYQKTGYRWLKAMGEYGFGGILADDMGLGKTLQVITLLLSERCENKGVSLIVVPTSLTVNWQKEFEKFAPDMKVVAMLGDAPSRQLILQNIDEYEVVVTSYDTLKRDIESYLEIPFNYCIADEAHYIKNANTQNAKALKMIKSEYRFALTGTPMENSLAELWSLFDFIMPGYLFTYPYFKKHFESPIVKEESAETTLRLQKMIAPFILRRLKKDVLKELPQKTEMVVYNTMEAEQKRIYKAQLAEMQQILEGEIKDKGVGKSHIKILAMITRLRQLCCHPGLYLEGYEGESGKLSQCMELIRESIEGGHKLLIFSQFTSMLEVISQKLQQEGVGYYMLTGATKAEKRMEMVEAFNVNDTPVFLISLKAGGTGLNLTGADIVIHYDPWWNVSSQNQATDRAYRIGQKNNVQVFKLITEDTIEEKIEKLQQRKLALTENVLKEGETFITAMTEAEIRDLFQP